MTMLGVFEKDTGANQEDIDYARKQLEMLMEEQSQANDE